LAIKRIWSTKWSAPIYGARRIYAAPDKTLG
jgi:hypothetical protein